MAGNGGAWARVGLQRRGQEGLSGQETPQAKPPAAAAVSWQWLLRAQGLQDVSGDGGVRKQELRSGSGPTVPPYSSVAVKYSGYLDHSDKPFCTNHSRRFPELMKLGKDVTLRGLDVGLQTMKKGEMARFVFSPDYAYGQQGCHPLIPPNATVMFEVEVLDFLDSAESDAFFKLTAEHQNTFPLQKVLEVSDTERQIGNYLYNNQKFECAKHRYKRALSILDRSPSSEAEHCQINASKLLVLLNLSLSYLKLQRPAQALAYGKKALKIDPRNTKALFRCGQACFLLTQYEKAQDFLVRAQQIEPFNRDINDELKKLASCYRDYLEKEKEMCFRMFASLTSASG